MCGKEETMRRIFRGRCSVRFAAAAVMAVLLFAYAEKAWAGDGLSGTNYKASEIDSETSAENIQFTGGIYHHKTDDRRRG